MNSVPRDIDTHQIDSQSLETEALNIVRSMESWNRGKQFHHQVPINSISDNSDTLITTDTFKTNLNDDYWVGRKTILNPSVTEYILPKFQDYLIGPLPIDPNNNHTSHEKNYIHDLYDYKFKLINNNSYLIKTFYKLPFPLSKRIFYNYVYIKKGEDYSLVISICIDPKNFEQDHEQDHDNSQFTVGNYTSVEYITTEQDQLHWKMCTSSTPNGNVPNWMTKLGLPGAIVNDVPSFVKYCDNN